MKKHQREDLGVELYGIQQELARYQMLLEKCHDDYAELEQDRKKTEQKLGDVRNMYKDSQLFVNKEKKKGALYSPHKSQRHIDASLFSNDASG